MQPKTKLKEFQIAFPETARSRSRHASYDPQASTLTGNEQVLAGGREAADVGGRRRHASYDPQLPSTPIGNELVLDGGREAADVGGIDAEGS